MKVLVILLLALSAALLASPRSGNADNYYPWCARYEDRGMATICSFDNKPQCMASVSGRGGFCLENWVPPPQGLAPVYGAVNYGKMHRTPRHRHYAYH
jgi:hypothetical protein